MNEDLPPKGGEQSLIVLQATIAHLKKAVQREAERRREAEGELRAYKARQASREAA